MGARGILVGLLFLAGTAVAATPAAKTKAKAPVPLPQLLTDIEAKYAKAKTLSATFDQTVESAVTKLQQKSSGSLKFKRPGRIRWETEKPDRSLFVSDGKKAWFYTPGDEEGENGSYHELAAGQAQSRLANALLSGSFSVARDMKIHQDSALKFTLTPKKGGPVTQALIEIEPRQIVIQKVILKHADGNRTEITLSGVQLGKEYEDSDFVFNPPPHTDKVED